MELKKRVGIFEEDAAILERIASSFGEGSKEYTAVKHASIALWYVLAEDHEGFQKYVVQFEGDLSPEQRAHLLEMGIDPDSAG
jgi:hypothetical protein